MGKDLSIGQAQAITPPTGLRAIQRPTAPVAPSPAAAPDRLQTAVPTGQPAVGVSLTATDGEPVQLAEVHADEHGRILDAQGRPYGGIELTYDSASGQVRDSRN